MDSISEKRTILITAVGCNTSISVAKCLRAATQEYRIIGVDIAPQHEVAGARWCDAYYQVSSFRDPGYVQQLLDIARRESVQQLFSVMDHEMVVIAHDRTVFEQAGIQVCIPELSVIERCNDKYETNSFLASHGIDIPKTFTVADIEQIETPQFPLFIKPRNGVSSADCYKVNTLEELHVFLSRVTDPIIQEYIAGDQYVIDVCCDLQGVCNVAIPRRELSSKAGIGVKAITVDDAALVAYGTRVAELLHLTGAANIEVFKSGDDIFLIEVNPRFSAGHVLSCAAGVNLPAIVSDLYAGVEVNEGRTMWQPGVYMTRYWQEVFTDTVWGGMIELSV